MGARETQLRLRRLLFAPRRRGSCSVDQLSSTAISSWTSSNNSNMKAVEEPAYLAVGTDVSAKYRGAFCEAKIKTVKRLVKVKVTLKGQGTSQVVHDDQVKGQLRVGSVVEVKTNEGGNSEAVIGKLTDASLYTVVFDDGDEKTLRRTSLCLKGERHFAESETLDQLPLTNPEHFGTPVISKKSNRGRRSSQAVADEEHESSSSSEEEQKVRVSDELLGTVCSVEAPDPALVLVLSPVCNEELVVKKENCLVRSFGDGKFLTVLRRNLHRLNSASICKPEFTNRKGLCAAQAFLRTRAVPEVWKMDLSQILESSSDSDEKHDNEDQEEQERRKKCVQEEPEEESDPEERDHFLQQLYKFMEDRGTPINKPPVLGYKDLNLFKLFRLVTHQSGCNAIKSGTVWKQIYIDLGIPVLNSAAAYNVKTAYKKYLFGFEEFCRSALITFRTIHHNNPRPPPSPANQKATSETKSSPANHRVPEPKSSPTSNQRAAGVDLKDMVKTETESESESDREERHASPRGRRSGGPLQDKRGTDSDEPRKRTPRQTDQSERTPRLTDQSECTPRLTDQSESLGRLSDQSERGSDDEDEDDEDEDDEDEDDELPHQPTERSEEDPDGVNGTRVRVKYGRGKTQKIYEAHIKKTDVDNGESFYLVHYYGWNVRYDEWVKADRIIWPSEKGSKKRRGKLKNKEDGPPEDERPPQMKGSGGRRGRPLGSKNKTNGRAPERRPESGLNLSNGENTPRRRTRRTSGMYDSDRMSNEDSGNLSDDSESEDSTEKKQFPWRQQEAGTRLKREEEEPSESAADSAPESKETAAPSMPQDSAHSQSEQGAGPARSPITVEKTSAPVPRLLEPSPRRLKLMSLPLPPRSEPMVILHHCLPPDSDTDSASETDSEKEDEKRAEMREKDEKQGRKAEMKVTNGEEDERQDRVETETKEKRRGHEEEEKVENVRSPDKLVNIKSPLRDRNLNTSPQKVQSIGDKSPLRSPAKDGETSVKPEPSEGVKSPLPSEKTQREKPATPLRPDKSQVEKCPAQNFHEGRNRPNEEDRTPENLVKPQPQNCPKQNTNSPENSSKQNTNSPENSPKQNPNPPENSPKQNPNPPENSPKQNPNPPENSPKQNPNPPENSPKQNPNPPENSPKQNPNPPENSPKRNTNPPENSLKRNTNPPENSLKRNTNPPENSPKQNPNPPENSPKQNPNPPENSPKQNPNPPENSPKQNPNPPENSLKRNTNPPENSPKRNTNPPENSPKIDENKEQKVDKNEDDKTPLKRKAPEQKSPEKKLKTEAEISPKTTSAVVLEQNSSAGRDEEKMEVCEPCQENKEHGEKEEEHGEMEEEQEHGEKEEEHGEKEEEQEHGEKEEEHGEMEEEQEHGEKEEEHGEKEEEHGEQQHELEEQKEEQCKQTVQEMGPDALVCHEVDLDEPDEREKAVSASEQLLLMMRESHLKLAPPMPVNAPPSEPETRDERGNEEMNSSPTSNSSNCDRGQKRVLQERHSPTVKKHKRHSHKRATPQKHDKNGAGHSSDSEDQSRVSVKSHKHCPSPTSRGHKWTLHIADLEQMSPSERISFLQDKLQEIRKYYLSLKSEVASIDRRRKRLKKKEREVSNTASASSSSDAAMSPASSSPSQQSSLAVEVR
ncbi:uncharacterized protein [Eucyclogobius newberryi]|uniref:uncharacterized protein isoform X2 n=1 Tax=Eucyclogobius newberryi TaxID=166745 RepID=UPI003B58CA97